MRKFIAAFLWFLIPAANALTIDVQPCNAVQGGITDIEFIDANSAFLTEKNGKLYYFTGCDKKVLQIKQFAVITRSELGLLGAAFAPDKQYLYLYYAPKDHAKKTRTRLSAFKLSLNPQPSISAEKILLEIEQPYNNHDGGALKFGPKGALYLGVGDGGSGGDPLNSGQDPATLLGSILRINVAPQTSKGYTIPSGNLQQFLPNAKPEIFAYGVRNPWKFSFDSKGNLIVADVGQNKLEEVSIISAASIGNNELNLGWRLKEAGACYNPETQCERPGLLNPVFEYGRNFGASITGGETRLFKGREYYFFADFATGKIAALDLANPSVIAVLKSDLANRWTTFGKAPNGDIYIADIEGKLYRLTLR